MTSRNNSEERLRSTEEECERLRAENTLLRAMLGIRNSTSGEYSQTSFVRWEIATLTDKPHRTS